MATVNDSLALFNHVISSDFYSSHNHHEHSADGHDHHDSDNNSSSNSHGHNNRTDELLVAKATAMLVLFTASMLCGMVPFKLSQWFKWSDTSRSGSSLGNNNIVTMLLSFGGGVLLCTTFLHMLPEVEENIEVLKHNNQLPGYMSATSVHYGQLLMCIGFFAMYFVEEIIHLYLHRVKRQHSQRQSSMQNGTLSRDESGIDVQSINENNFHSRFPNRKKTSISVAELISTDSNDVEHGNVIGINYTSNQMHCALPKNCALDINENGKAKCDYDRHNIQIMEYNAKRNAGNSMNVGGGNAEARSHDCQDEHHSHLPLDAVSDDDNVIVSSLRGLLIVLALSVHELFEGLAVGLESSASNVWYMFGAVATHKLVIAFCVSVELIVNKTKFCLATLYICTFAVVSPIGIAVGIWISHKGSIEEIRQDEHLLIFDPADGIRNDELPGDNGTSPNIVAVVLQGLATGTLLYVVFFEILIKSRTTSTSNKKNVYSGILQYISVLVGFFIMLGMQFLGMPH